MGHMNDLASEMVRLQDENASLRSQLAEANQTIERQYQRLVNIGERLLETCDVLDDVNSQLAEAKAAADKRICNGCLEVHPLDVMCPPHETRTTGQQWFRQKIAEFQSRLAEANEKFEKADGWRESWKGAASVQHEMLKSLNDELAAAQARVERLEGALKRLLRACDGAELFERDREIARAALNAESEASDDRNAREHKEGLDQEARDAAE